MHQAPRVIFLESQFGTESLFTRGLRSGAVCAGWNAEVVFLADTDGTPRSEKEVRIELLEKRPDTVCFLMDAPLHLKNIWDAPSLVAVDKVSLWFDDYYRSPKTLSHPETWTEWQKTHGVRVGIWDGYWRCRWKEFTGVEAFPLHLAADPRLLRPNAEAWNRAWCERAAFVGTVPSLKSLDESAQGFPSPLRRLLEEVVAAMDSAAWPIKPYDLSNHCRSFLGIKYSRAVDAMLKEPATLALWHHMLWRWGKRVARLRGLAAVAKTGPIAVMSGHGTEVYAGEDELRASLPKGIDMVYADTQNMPAAAWKGLFRTGKWHLQITDPQSVEGGLPFRVFECAACAMPLLSDSRTELTALFPPGHGVFTAVNEAGLTDSAAKLFQMPRKQLEDEGQAFHRSFMAQHTWEVRWRQLVQHCQQRSQSQYFPALLERPTPLTRSPVSQAA